MGGSAGTRQLAGTYVLLVHVSAPMLSVLENYDRQLICAVVALLCAAA